MGGGEFGKYPTVTPPNMELNKAMQEGEEGCIKKVKFVNIRRASPL